MYFVVLLASFFSFQMADYRIICGLFIHATEENSVVFLLDTAVGINTDGKITFLVSKEELPDVLQEHGLTENHVEYLTSSQFIIPGFIDTHIHASQYSYHGTGTDRGLLDWLQTYTFPTESRFKDPDFANDVYAKAVKRLIKSGTTTASYYATIHVDSTVLLCKTIDSLGQRALVGKVNMNQNCPDYYKEDTSDSINQTLRFIHEVKKLNSPLITPCITPRFAVACSSDLMTSLGSIVKKENLPVQTHLSECIGECTLVKSLHPQSKNYLDVYSQAGLLTNKTILAHSIYLSDEELDVIKSNDCGISHCPNSNLTLRSGLLDARKIIQKNIKLGLGTDVAGGYSCSMLDAIRQCVQVSKTLAIYEESKNNCKHYSNINFKDAFKLATLGGAKVLGLQDTIGNFEVGKDFDALLVDVGVPDGNFDVFNTDSLDDKFQKFIFLGDDRNITKVYVAGKQVK